MDVLGSTGQLELGLSRTQMDGERQVRALASGLRVVSASDDPSGLAIAENIHTKVLGLQQGVQNVQNAGNLLNVADSTLDAVQQILTRIHELIIEAGSDLNSSEQLQSLQSEIDELLHEVNKIAGNAKFNGVTLFDGSHDGTLGLIAAPFAKQLTATNPTNSATAGTQVYDQQNTGHADPGPLMYNVFYGQPNFTPGYIEIDVLGYSSNPVDPTTGVALGQPGVLVRTTQYSTSSSFGGSGGATEQQYTQALATSNGIDNGTFFPVFLPNANGTGNMLRFDLANLSPQDTGVSMAFETFDPSNPNAAPSGQALQINSSGNEGGIVSINLPSVSISSLGISGITVLTPQVVDGYNNPIGPDTTNEFAVMDAESRVQNAIDAVSGARAKIGAQTVSLEEDANDASLEVVNQVASESAIRDVNVGQAATQFTRDQVLTQIGISVLAQMQQDAQLVIQLVGAANPQTGGLI